jgi:hypothetical protein
MYLNRCAKHAKYEKGDNAMDLIMISGKYRGNKPKEQASIEILDCLLETFANSQGFSTKDGKTSKSKGYFTLDAKLAIERTKGQWEICLDNDCGESVVRETDDEYWSLWMPKRLLHLLPYGNRRAAIRPMMSTSAIVFDHPTGNTEGGELCK